MCVVGAAADGEQALESAHRRRPDLIGCDIMMPRMDELALLKALRRAGRTEPLYDLFWQQGSRGA